MKPMKHLVFLTVLLLLFAFASQSYADISDAALLYLRIAPGSRAAGMGESYVAVSNDATATHWNPAGLGATPLANNWMVENIPQEMQPITEMAAVKARGGGGHNAYDIWTISPNGLSRFDNHHWFSYEVFSTRTDQTVAGIVKNYFNIEDEIALESAVAKVISENSSVGIESLESFKDNVLTIVPEDYSDREALQIGFDSLLAAYSLCQVNWEKFNEAQALYNESMKDSVLSEKEIDRINFAVEKSKSRFIPEDLKVPYSSLVTGEITDIKGIGKLLFVGTSNGLFSYNGSSWKSYNTNDGLPSMNILTLSTVSGNVMIGTDSGIVKYNGNAIVIVGNSEQVVEGLIVAENSTSGEVSYDEKENLQTGSEVHFSKKSVTAIGGTSSVDVYAISEGHLYYYDGQKWTDNFTYKTSIDDSFESIAKKLSIYDTENDINYIINKIKELNKVIPLVDDGQDSTEIEVAETPVLDSTTATDSVETIVEDIVADSNEEFVIEPGKEILVPFSGIIKGSVNEIHIHSKKQLYLASDHGLLSFAHSEGDGVWKMVGYKEVIVEEGQTIQQIAESNYDMVTSVENNVEVIKAVNDLESDELVVGQLLKVYSNPTALPVNDLTTTEQILLIATTNGMYELYNNSLSRTSSSGLNSANIIKVDAHGNEFWYASNEKIIIKASGRNEIAGMFAKWLPELADDIYYGFLSGVTNINGLGTVGLSFTYINYGRVDKTDENSPVVIGSFEPFDIAIAASYGTSLTNSIKGGLSMKFIYSHLSRLGAGDEQGEGTATGLAIDFGFLWYLNQRFNLGLAVTNLGPDISYIDAGQSDPLPRNLAFGFAWKPKSTEYYHFMITGETNYSLVGMDGSLSEELKELIFNGGAEFQYNDIFAIRGGYIYDEEGDVKSLTIGCGLAPINRLNLDFAYIPSGTDAPLANTLRISTKYSW